MLVCRVCAANLQRGKLWLVVIVCTSSGFFGGGRASKQSRLLGSGSEQRDQEHEAHFSDAARLPSGLRMFARWDISADSEHCTAVVQLEMGEGNQVVGPKLH